MKVILLGEIKGRGGEGDVVEVATGFAVNYLFPRKLAVAATKGNLKQLELRKHNIAKRETDRLDTADKLVAALEGQTLRVGAKVGEEGQLFGSVTTQQIADAIKERFNAEVDRKRIDLHGAIKTAGEHSITINIYRELKATLTVEVVDEKILNAAAEPEGEAEVEAAEPVVEAESKAESAIDVEVEAETVAEAESAIDVKAEAEVATETATDAEAEVETESEPAAEAEE